MNEKVEPLVSIVMLVWNRKDYVEAGLNEIFKSTYQNLEVIVVDNASDDGTSAMVAEKFPSVKLISLNNNIGIQGFNIGFKSAKGKYIVVLDDDSYPLPDSIDLLVHTFESEPESTAIIAGKVINPEQNFKDCTKGWPKEMITFWGCGAAIRRDLIEEYGGYCEEFFLYRNELEMSIRFKSHGYNTIYNDKIIFYHHSAMVNRTSVRAFLHNNRNDIYIFWKYYPFFTSLNYLSKIFVLSFIKSIIKYGLNSFVFIWKPFFTKWLWEETTTTTDQKYTQFLSFIDHKKWRDMNFIQPKLTDLPIRLIKRQIIY